MNLLSILDLKPEQLKKLVAKTEKVKTDPEKYASELEGKTLALIFEKPSTRTRISFEVAMLELGGNAIVLNASEMQLGRGETIADSAKVLSRYVDAVMARVYSHETLKELASTSTIPIINGLSDLEHPCQIISDLFTIYEEKRKFEGLKLAYIGDGNNVCNSLMLGSAMVGLNITVATPKGYAPKPEIIAEAEKFAKKYKSQIVLTENPEEAVAGADIIYTDVWVSMGNEKEEKKRMKAFAKYQLNKPLVKKAKRNCMVMHCLPAHRGQEITDDVIDSPNSAVWDQAENRLHAQKAILLTLMKD